MRIGDLTMKPMPMRLKRCVVGGATLFCITLFLYQLIELSTLNITNIEERQQLLEEDDFQVHSQHQHKTEISPDKNPHQNNNYVLKAQFSGDTPIASKSLLTFRVLSSLDKFADVHTNSHRKTFGTVLTEQHLRPTNFSDMIPSGTGARLPATCPSVGFPTIPAPTSAWQVVAHDQSYVFSAFMERRLDRRAIKVVGTADTRKKRQT